MYKSKIGWATHVNEPFLKDTNNTTVLDYNILKKIHRNRKQKSSILAYGGDGQWTEVGIWESVNVLQACSKCPHLCYLLTNDATAIPEIVRMWSLQYRQEEWPANVWLGFTATDQESFNKNWVAFTDEADGVLGRFPDVNVFVQYKAVGALVLPRNFYPNRLTATTQKKEWGESGLKWHGRWLIGSITKNLDSPEWLNSIRGQCVDNGILFYFINGSVHDLDYMLFGEEYKETPLGIPYHVMYNDKNGKFNNKIMHFQSFAEVEKWLTSIGAKYWEVG